MAQSLPRLWRRSRASLENGSRLTSLLCRYLGTSTSIETGKVTFPEAPSTAELFRLVAKYRVRELAQRPPSALKLNHLYHLGSSQDPKQRLRNAQFLHNELPLRVAQRIMELGAFLSSASIRSVTAGYLQFLHRLLEFPLPQNAADEEAYTDLLQTMVRDPTGVPAALARGVQELQLHRQAQKMEKGRSTIEMVLEQQKLEDALERFFTARVGLRFLAEHHVLSCPRHEEQRKATNLVFVDSSGMRGLIQPNCPVVSIVQEVADLVEKQTIASLGACPPLEVVDCGLSSSSSSSSSKKSGRPNSSFTFVPHHLQYMIAELLKNAARAVVRTHNTQHDNLPPVTVVIAQGKEDVTLKIADRGGGIPRSSLPTVWNFSHSTASSHELETAFGQVLGGAHIQGFGLPLARIYARYFGGELTLKSTEGYGLDAYLYLPRLGDEACEHLPKSVEHSPGEGDSTPTFHTAISSDSSSSSGSDSD